MAAGKSDFKVITVTPTLSTDAYSQYDVLFNPVEIPNAVIGNGGCSKLKAMFMVDQDAEEFDAVFIFSQNNTNLGTINATADIADADLEAMNIIGMLRGDADVSSGSTIDNARISQIMNSSAGSSNVTIGTTDMLLQAADNSTSVYVSAIIHSNSTPTFAAADDIDLILHIEYR
tara:strand:+ start:26 stop:547 length:522 start_codon:yes stop_codon:yes gene_type:complete